eukprot:1289432-Pyramimonas_sp.AAC.1
MLDLRVLVLVMWHYASCQLSHYDIPDKAPPRGRCASAGDPLGARLQPVEERTTWRHEAWQDRVVARVRLPPPDSVVTTCASRQAGTQSK